MTLIKSATETKRQSSSAPKVANIKSIQLVDVDLSQGVTAANDLIAAAILSIDCTLLGLTLIANGLPAGTTATVGLLTGDVGDPEGMRELTAPNTIASGLDVAANSVASVPLETCIAVPTSDVDRSVGIVLDTDVPLGNASLTVFLEYAVTRQ